MVALGETVFVAWALQVVATIGVADHMSNEPRPVDDLAAATGTAPDALYRALRLLGMHGVFTEPAPRQFALTPLGDCLRSDAPDSVRSWFEMNAPINRVLFEAPLESLLSGAPAFERVIGAPFFEYAAINPRWGAVFDAAMADVGRRTAAAVARAYDFRGIHRTVDVGGGTGTLISAILQGNPGMFGVVFDQPHVADRARDALAAAGLAGRCEVAVGSFFEAVPPGADAYLLSWIIHDWDDDRAVSILENCHDAIPAAGRLLLIEFAVPEGDAPHLAKSMDIAMLVALGGRERTVPEYRRILERAGFSLERVIPLDSAMSILEAIPAP